VPPRAEAPGLSPSPGGSGCPRAYGPKSPLAGGGGLPPRRWLRVPAGQGPEVSRCRVASGFSVPEARRSPLPGGFGFLRARGSEAPVAGWPGVAPAPRGGESPLRRWLRISSWGQRPRIRPLPVAPGFLRPGAREFPLPGGSGCLSGRDLKSSLCRFGSGVSPLPWLGFPLRRLPFPVVGKFLRLSREPHKRFPPTISRFFGRPQAIHS